MESIRTCTYGKLQQLMFRHFLRGYYHSTLERTLSGSSVAAKTFRLLKGHLGKSKEILDLLDLELNVRESVGTFGSYIKYMVDDDEEEEGYLKLCVRQRQLSLY